MRKHNLVSNSIYHIYNRGVEKRRLFMDEQDYFRFVKCLCLFNDSKPILNAEYKFKNLDDVAGSRNMLVDMLAFCLMPNHFHLLLRQREKNGITKFMRKLCVGYANYFNLKHRRVGSLFQGRFKSVLIQHDSQFGYIPYYIHLNPLDLVVPDWRENGVSKLGEAVDFLNSYKWSSHTDYLGKPNFPLVSQRGLLNEYFGGSAGYKRDFNIFIKDLDFTGSDLSLFLE